MTVLISILTFLVIIIVLVLAHEIGHFTTAKLTGVTVEEFGLFYLENFLRSLGFTKIAIEVCEVEEWGVDGSQ